MKLRIQAGVESFKDGVRIIRFTPLDEKVDVAQLVGELLIALATALDHKDFQPGDGELDIPLRELPPSIRNNLGAFAVPQGNAFVRISRVAEPTKR
jgi:hypothetical protein